MKTFFLTLLLGLVLSSTKNRQANANAVTSSMSVGLQAQPKGLPDLVLSPAKPVKFYFQPGEPMGSVQIGVTNQGKVATPNFGKGFQGFKIRFALSTDTIFKEPKKIPSLGNDFAEDMILRHKTIHVTETVGVNQLKLFVVNFDNLPSNMKVACKKQKFYLVIQVDSADTVSESNEGNNIRFVPLTICVNPPQKGDH